MSQGTRSVSIRKTGYLMLYIEIETPDCDKRKKYINTLRKNI